MNVIEHTKLLARLKFYIVFLTLSVSGLAGCSVLEPNVIKTEYTHISHISQHEPFTSHATSYGINAVGIIARWEYPQFYFEIGEGLSTDPSRLNGEACGSFYGPREQTTIRIGHEWRLH